MWISFTETLIFQKKKINVVQKLKSIGYVYDEVDGISRFYKGDLLELEFLTRVLGAGTDGKVNIKPLGITSEGLRVINILSDFAREIESTATDGEKYTLIIPEPSAYLIQKILTNPDREPQEKRAKDIVAVKELLYHIEKSTEHKTKFSEVYKTLSVKQLKIIKQVCEENQIVLP